MKKIIIYLNVDNQDLRNSFDAVGGYLVQHHLSDIPQGIVTRVNDTRWIRRTSARTGHNNFRKSRNKEITRSLSENLIELMSLQKNANFH